MQYACGPGCVTFGCQELNHRRTSQLEMEKRGKLRALVDRFVVVDTELRCTSMVTLPNYNMQIHETQLQDSEVRRAAQRVQMVWRWWWCF